MSFRPGLGAVDRHRLPAFVPDAARAHHLVVLRALGRGREGGSGRPRRCHAGKPGRPTGRYTRTVTPLGSTRERRGQGRGPGRPRGRAARPGRAPVQAPARPGDSASTRRSQSASADGAFPPPLGLSRRLPCRFAVGHVVTLTAHGLLGTPLLAAGPSFLGGKPEFAQRLLAFVGQLPHPLIRRDERAPVGPRRQRARDHRLPDL